MWYLWKHSPLWSGTKENLQMYRVSPCQKRKSASPVRSVLRLTLQLYGQHHVYFVVYKITHVFCNYPVHSVVGVPMANCSCGKLRLLNGKLRASCQETCTVRGSALLPHTLGKCEKNVWEDTWRNVPYISWENEWTWVVYCLKTFATNAISRTEWSNSTVNPSVCLPFIVARTTPVRIGHVFWTP